MSSLRENISITPAPSRINDCSHPVHFKLKNRIGIPRRPDKLTIDFTAVVFRSGEFGWNLGLFWQRFCFKSLKFDWIARKKKTTFFEWTWMTVGREYCIFRLNNASAFSVIVTPGPGYRFISSLHLITYRRSEYSWLSTRWSKWGSVVVICLNEALISSGKLQTVQMLHADAYWRN